jgi:hypothetical protein
MYSFFIRVRCVTCTRVLSYMYDVLLNGALLVWSTRREGEC